METRSLKWIGEACGGTVQAGFHDRWVNGVATDSRSVGEGELFIALRGERFDGHEFVGNVAGKGAGAVMVNADQLARVPGGCPAVVVEDTRHALGLLAAAYRREFDLPVVAVVGSNGKTSTKELVAGVMRRHRHTLWSQASYNNEIGVPLTLLRLESSHEVVVVELGTNHPGELAPLIEMAQPSVGVVTNIAREHLEHFESLEGVFEEEGTLCERLPARGKLLLNADDEWCARLVARSEASVWRLGASASADWWVSDVSAGPDGTLFNVKAPAAGYSGEYRVALLGRHQVFNALFAIGVGALFEVPQAEVREALEAAKPAPGRMQVRQGRGFTVIDDSYNANTDSMIASLDALAELPCSGRRIAVLGDMAEQGAHAEAAHGEVGRHAAAVGIDSLVAVGEMAEVTVGGAVSHGLSNAVAMKVVAGAADYVRQSVKPEDVVLVKASRDMRLERVVEGLCGEIDSSEI